MKKLFALVLTMAALLLALPAMAAELPSWERIPAFELEDMSRLDSCFVNRKPFIGTFNSATVKNAPLEAYVLLGDEEDSIAFRLMENGTTLLRNLGLDDWNYQISVIDTKGKVYPLQGYMFPGEGVVTLSPAYDRDIFFDLLLAEGKLRVEIVQVEQPLNRYRFTVENGKELYDPYFRVTSLTFSGDSNLVWVNVEVPLRGSFYGAIDVEGNLALPFAWDHVSEFVDGIAQVQQGEQCGLIDASGKIITPCEWDVISWFFYEERCMVIKDDKFGFINPQGELVIPCEWDDAIHFNDGLAGVKRNGLWGFINPQGELVIPCEWELAGNFSEGLAAVVKNGKVGYINPKGQLVIPCEWDWAGLFSEGLAAVEENGKWGYIDSTGKLAIPCDWDRTASFSNGMASVSKNGLVGIINTDGQLVVPCEWEAIMRTNIDDLFAVQRNNLWGYLDSAGQLVCPCGWEEVRSFYEGVAMVQRNERWGYLYPSGHVAISCKWDDAQRFYKGFAKVQEWDKWGYIDTSGTPVIPCEYRFFGQVVYTGSHFFILKDGVITILDSTLKKVAEVRTASLLSALQD